MKFHFFLRFHTKVGQSIWLGGNAKSLQGDGPAVPVQMHFLNNDYWDLHIDIPRDAFTRKGLQYKYYLQNAEGELLGEWGHDRVIELKDLHGNNVELRDIWNHAGEFENAFFTTAFKDVLLPDLNGGSGKNSKHFTHLFKVKAPLLHKHQCICISGEGDEFSNWSQASPVLMSKEGDWWYIKLDLSPTHTPIAYKYGVFDMKAKRFLNFEEGDNRLVHASGDSSSITILQDGFAHLPNNTWKGAGVAIPVFSLRSKESFGVGEFTDIKLLVDWAKASSLKLIQILPINDTVATNSWEDSYPYAAISAFALHPLYINLSKITGKKSEIIKSLKSKQQLLNEETVVNYEQVMKFKMAALRELYEEEGTGDLDSDEYKKFFQHNQHWLKPYAVFCYLRDKNGNSRYEEWPDYSVYNEAEINTLYLSESKQLKQISFYLFIQYHLHLQLKDAADYANKKGIVLKGDIPIGIYRYGCDAWVAPDLYNMEAQAGAPPDDFTPIGQNWGFPTYNWKRMQEDGFAWWKQRFEQMSNYFDAFRIDHILGFFRIWTIPSDAVQGILGHFVPCIPVHYVEFGENGIWFDQRRFCKPFINDQILWEIFGELNEKVKEVYLQPNDSGGFDLKEEFESQKKIEAHFAEEQVTQESEKIRNGLYDLVANVILFVQEGSREQEFHFRISMEQTYSFKYLIPHVQEKLKSLYINYFFRRQDEFWRKEAMHKLPYLKAATNMLVCGEDLGMVPDCVPDVMKQLGILSLEIQRMPKDILKEFFHPNDAPYMSVITPSTHDMSTVRGWWEENRERTQQFFNSELGQWGTAPYFCEAWVNRAIVLQHLYAPAMWSIFQLQDIMGMSETLRRENPNEERINNPANPKNYWQYRMHLTLEDLIQQDDFNNELKEYVENSGR